MTTLERMEKWLAANELRTFQVRKKFDRFYWAVDLCDGVVCKSYDGISCHFDAAINAALDEAGAE